jgi:putative transcriptional regulator
MSGTALRNQIRRLRFERGEMTQDALARAVGVTRQTIIALEAGRYAPSLELAFRLARTFGVGVEAVFQDPALDPGAHADTGSGAESADD